LQTDIDNQTWKALFISRESNFVDGNNTRLAKQFVITTCEQLNFINKKVTPENDVCRNAQRISYGEREKKIVVIRKIFYSQLSNGHPSREFMYVCARADKMFLKTRSRGMDIDKVIANVRLVPIVKTLVLRDVPFWND